MAMFDGYDDLGAYGEMNPVWGFVAGSAIAGVSMVVAKAMGASSPRLAKYAGLFGAAVGAVASVIALIPESTRRAGWLGLAGAALVALPEVVRQMILVPRGLGEAEDFGYYDASFAAPEQPALEILSGVQPGMGALPAPVQILQGAPQMGYNTAEFAGPGSGW